VFGKALRPILWILAAVLLLAAAAYWYEKKWGAEGPFEDNHHHGHGH